MTTVRHLQPPQAKPVEFSTDAPHHAEDLAAAFAEFLPVTGGDKTAAAVLAVGAVLADHLQRSHDHEHNDSTRRPRPCGTSGAIRP